MSTNFDWSHFEEVPKQSAGTFNWNQYEAVQEPPPPDNRTLPQKVIGKAARLGTQATLGAIQRAAAGYDIPAILARKQGIAAAPQEFRQNIFEDIERLQEQKAAGQWDESDQEQYNTLVDLIKNPEKMEQYIPKEENVPHFDVGGLIEAGARKLGVDLTPQGADEMALRWIGFIKNPAKARDLLKNGPTPQNIKEVIKALAPTGKEALRGIGAGSALQYAAEAELGPIGMMAAAIIGDMAPSLALKTGAGALKFAKAPITSTKQAAKAVSTAGKKLAAKGVALFTPRDKIALQQAIIKDFNEAGVQADLGTISGSNMVTWVQNALAQSGLTGAPLEEFKKSLTRNIVTEYKKLAGELGESIYQSKYEAGEALQTGLREARDSDLASARDLYNSAKERAGSSQVATVNVSSLIQEIEETLTPGAFKSTEQKAVLDILNKIKNDVMTPSGEARSADIRALINNKIALNDAINYEVQGGAKQLLKRLVSEIDDAISSHGKVDSQFAKEWAAANKKFAEHAKLFRGKTLDQALKTQDPSAIFNKMNTPHGINQIRKALSTTPEGRKLFNELAAYKLQELIGQNMVNSTTGQLNFGTFSKLLEKGQNRQIVKSILGSERLAQLERLQKASGRLADTAQKFLNTSRSGVHASDMIIIGKTLTDIGSILTGNPWPLIRTGGIYLASKQATKLMADPQFLKLVERAIIESKLPKSQAFRQTASKLADVIKKSNFGDGISKEIEGGESALSKARGVPSQQRYSQLQRPSTREKTKAFALGEQIPEANPNIGAREAQLLRERSIVPTIEASQRGRQSLENVLETNPDYTRISTIKGEPDLYLRKRDIGLERFGVNDALPLQEGQILRMQKEWDKYLNPTQLKLYNSKINYKSTFGDYISDPALREHFKEILDLPVNKVNLKGYSGAYRSPMAKFGYGGKEMRSIDLQAQLSPQRVFSVLMHEGTHALQDARLHKPSGMSRLTIRNITDTNPYLSKLNEVYARKYQNWIDRPVNKYRSGVEKTKKAQELWEEQRGIKRKPRREEYTKTDLFWNNYNRLNDKGQKLYNEWNLSFPKPPPVNDAIDFVKRLNKDPKYVD